MKIKIPSFLTAGVPIFIWLILLIGCAATDSATKNISQVPPPVDEEPNELKITKFILGAGDTIEISVFRHDDMKREIQINNTGIITYPLVGDVKATGFGILQLRDKLRDGLSKYIINPQVSVTVTSVQSQKFSVLGEVNNPGIFSLESSINFLEAMAKAGGFTIDAKQKSIILIRGGISNPQLMKLNIEETWKEGDFNQLASLKNGDIIYVPATNISNVSRYFDRLSRILTPILQLETGYFLGQRIDSQSSSGTSISAK